MKLAALIFDSGPAPAGKLAALTAERPELLTSVRALALAQWGKNPSVVQVDEDHGAVVWRRVR